MKSATIRVVVIISLLACVGIIATQIFWVQRELNIFQRGFNGKVNRALMEVSDKLASYQHVPTVQATGDNPVDQINPNFYLLQTQGPISQDMVTRFLPIAFINNGITTDFEYTLYNPAKDTVDFYGYYHMSANSEQEDVHSVFPKQRCEGYTLGVYFPHRQRFLYSQLSLWTFTTIMLGLVLAFLGYLLFIIFKQKRLSEVQKDFVSNMTHEFKTPLSNIQLSADVLKDPEILNQPQRLLNYATIISNESIQLAAHVERVLQMTHAEQGKMLFKKQHFTWQDLLQETVNSFNTIAQSRNGKVTLHMPKEPIPGVGDMLHLKNVIVNLMDNAVKYCQQDPDINITLSKQKGAISIAVADNGIGIDPRHQKMLFQRFYRVPTGNIHDVKGFGMGLNYVRLICREHNGSVVCSSQFGKGSTFTLTFPFEKTL